ncbi:MAG: 2,3-bisphosphoglycerate-independent phosphoglycerate mutase [Calditrichaceae bacterium]|jgi:2,3-bisphosphoglycerate-independent phosphoglycerate mutase
MELEFMRKLAKPSVTKIVLLVLDGLGGLTDDNESRTELETAVTPNLDNLANSGVCGLHQPVGTGITPGSGPAHLGLFGYDPTKYIVGRGVLSALGVNFNLKAGDVAVRGNFCTIDKSGKITDRRAGRISTDKNSELCDKLRKIKVDGAEIFVETIKEHRFLLVMRGEKLSGNIDDTDPQIVGESPLNAKALEPDAETTCKIVNNFIDQAKDILSDQEAANMILLRGFSQKPDWPVFPKVYQLKAAAIAAYPMYRGVARLVGMDVLETGGEIEQEIETLKKHWDLYDFFYLHIKPTDSSGEDGDFGKKIKIIEHVDSQLPKILELIPDVFIVTGDHSTPALLGSHSWHPVPVVLWSKSCLPDNVDHFGERACIGGGLGPRFPADELMPLTMANAMRLEKFGA